LGDDLISEDSLDITVDILSSQLPPSAVEIGVDGQTITTLQDAPFAYTLDVLDIGSGDHTLDLTIILPDGNAYQQSEGFSVDPALFITPSPTPTDIPTIAPTVPSDSQIIETFTPDANAINAEATLTVQAESRNSTATAVIAGATSSAEAQAMNDTATAVVDNATSSAATDAEVAQAASDTPAPTDVPDTDTPEPSDTPAPTATASPEPSDTPEPSETPEEEDTDTPEPSATVSATEEGEPEDVTVSAEDEGDGSSSVLPIVGIVVLLVIVVAGYLFTRRGSNQQSA
jgi:hypothetical protein